MPSHDAAREDGHWVMAVDDPDFRWAVEARRVTGVADRTQWTGDPPIDVAERLSRVGGDDGAGGRVLTLAVGARTVPVLARGALSLEHLDAAALSPLPALVRDAGCADALSGVVLPSSGRATFLIAPERLGAGPTRSLRPRRPASQEKTP